jgi:hypothetical protein
LEQVAALLPSNSSAFEFGSGCSTHVLRSAFPAVASVESSAEWLDKTEQRERSIARRPSDVATVIALERCWNRFRPIESFNLEKHVDILERLKQARLILVDSPPNPAKREHALFLALRYAPPGAAIVLDDLEVRAVSRFAHRLAKQNASAFRFWVLNIDHKLAIYLKLRQCRVRSWPTLVEFVGTWLRA